MSPEAQRIAIAKACPHWSHHHGGKYCSVLMQHAAPELLGKLFDPLTDLHAMHEASVNCLSFKDTVIFVEHIKSILRRDAAMSPNEAALLVVDSSAAQRAEAFLRTIGKWEESA